MNYNTPEGEGAFSQQPQVPLNPNPAYQNNFETNNPNLQQQAQYIPRVHHYNDSRNPNFDPKLTDVPRNSNFDPRATDVPRKNIENNDIPEWENWNFCGKNLYFLFFVVKYKVL